MALFNEELTQRIIGAAIEVHREIGPGLLENVYEECLCRELELQSIPLSRQVWLDLNYKGRVIPKAYKLDLLISDIVIVELKAVEKIVPVHEAQLLSQMSLAKIKIGLLINFHVKLLKDGIVRRVLDTV